MNVWVEKVLEVVPAQRIHCAGVIAESLEVFQDHFPDFPVLPGVLALEILRETVGLCKAQGQVNINSAQSLMSLSAVKFQHFLKPGEFWESYASYSPGQPEGSWSVKLMVQDRTAVSARMCFYQNLN